jgi:queuine tRNA-ribosyltransferase
VSAPSFRVRASSSECAARVGRLETPHGALDTPAFLPVGTHAAVRGLAPGDLREAGVQGVLANTYHLHLRPGEEVVQKLGGLHRFMGWDGPILTDSGGFQLFSQKALCRRSEDGIEFQSPIDGSARRLTPERCIEVQERLGADLVAALDEFEPIGDGSAAPGARERARDCLERTLRWALRCRKAQRRSDQLLFGIAQGGAFEDLRAESAERTLELGFGAVAIGGLGLGEPAAQRRALLGAALRPLPAPIPRYAMGLGTPEDLVAAVELGVDLFDCVIPTRHGRHGIAFTRGGPRNLRNARFRDESGPLDPDCGCRVCSSFPAAYLRHLLVANEMLGPRLLSHHNLAFYSSLLAELRAAIAADRFAAFAADWRSGYSA